MMHYTFSTSLKQISAIKPICFNCMGVIKCCAMQMQHFCTLEHHHSGHAGKGNKLAALLERRGRKSSLCASTSLWLAQHRHTRIRPQHTHKLINGCSRSVCIAARESGPVIAEHGTKSFEIKRPDLHAARSFSPRRPEKRDAIMTCSRAFHLAAGKINISPRGHQQSMPQRHKLALKKAITRLALCLQKMQTEKYCGF
jgi:hypothetical protein